MTAVYPVVIHKDEGSDYGVIVPDVPGCFSGGATVAEALAMAREAVESHLLLLDEMDEPVPRPSPVEAHVGDPDYAGGVWALVAVDLSGLRERVRRVNVTMPQRVLDALDARAEREGETRSGLLTRLAVAHLDTPARAPGPESATPKDTTKRARRQVAV